MKLTATVRVLEVFDSLQGEGYWTGTPMTFVRLAGCNAPALRLGCLSWCDTRESWDPAAGEDLTIGEIMRRSPLPRLCITGGEPLLQLEGLLDLLAEAHRRERRVHVETNGTLGPPEGAAEGFDWVTVSPKPPDYLIAEGWNGRVDELKLVADDSLDAATAERLAASHSEAMVFIQPQSGTSVERAIALVMDHPEWRLSLQTHKLLGIR